MLQNALNQRDQMDNDIIIVVHALAEEDALMLQARLKEETNAHEVLLTTAGCVISSHCGPQTIGIMYAKKA
jgi:fatty acid-binding protein DegV